MHQSVLTLYGLRPSLDTVTGSKDLIALHFNVLKPWVLRLQSILDQLTQRQTATTQHTTLRNLVTTYNARYVLKLSNN